MCLTGVDYFSTLGYQPGIALVAAGLLSPIATLLLVLLTLFGALPMYKRVAEKSPHGDGSISMLEKLLPYWWGKAFVLSLIGFAATGFIITITLSAADASAHLIENPFIKNSATLNSIFGSGQIWLTLLLIASLGGIFLKGFKEAVGIAVGLVTLYLLLNGVVIFTGLSNVFSHPTMVPDWKAHIFEEFGNPFRMLGAALLVFPKLALGLSGFETGVVVMPLVKGDSGDTEKKPKGRIQNAQKLLTVAAILMSIMLITSSLATTFLVPKEAYQPGGAANGRALAYLAHHMLGDGFGTAYDVSTILILWFAGASAMAGLLNIVPRYLPRYGMAPEWTKAVRPLVLIFTFICFVVTLVFQANVEKQAAAYATGVLGLMTSATIAVTLSSKSDKKKFATIGFGIVALIFIYTTAINIIEQPQGLVIALTFVLIIILLSIISRIWRTLELRVDNVKADMIALQMINEAAQGDHLIRIIPNRPETRDEEEYECEEREARDDHQIPPTEKILFFEVYVSDASDFSGTMQITGHRIGEYNVLRAHSVAIPNGIAAFLIWICNLTGKRPHAYFNWTEGNPVKLAVQYLLFGKGEAAPLTREILRRVEPDPKKRPIIHSA